MAELPCLGSSSNVEIPKQVTCLAEAEQQAEHLHNHLANELHEELSESEYQKLRQLARSWLGAGSLAECENIRDIFNMMDSRDKIRIGDYKQLTDMFERAQINKLCMVIKRTEQTINDLLKTGQEVERNRLASQGQTTASRQSSNDEHGMMHNLADPRLQSLREKSERWLGVCKSNLSVFVKTKVYRDAKERIDEEGHVVVLGGPGDGKSFILQQICVDMSEEGYLLLYIGSPDDIEPNFVTGEKLLFVFDDVFGGPCFFQSRLDCWLQKNDFFFQQFTKSGNVRFLFASRKLIWSDCKHAVTSINLFQSSVDVSSKKLSPAERKQMLMNHMADNHKLSYYVIGKISELEAVAFPESCRRLSMSDVDMKNEADIFQIFANPLNFLCEEIQKLRERGANQSTEMWQFAALVLVMLNKGVLQEHQLDPNMADDAFKKTVEAVLTGCSIGHSRPHGKIRDSADNLCGTFLTKDSGCFKFDHDSVLEAVVKVYGVTNPEHILEFCNPELVVSVCRPANFTNVTDSCIVKLNSNYYSRFVQILIDEVKKGGWYVFGNPSVRNEDIQEKWIEQLQTSNDRHSYILNHTANIIYHAAESGTFKLLIYLYEHIEPEYVQSCFSSDTYHPFVGLAAGGHTMYIRMYLEQLPGKLYDKGLTVGAANRTVKPHTRTGDEGPLNVVKLFLQHNVSPNTLREGFERACERGHKAIVQLLLQHGIDTHTLGTGFLRACVRGHTDIVQLLLQHDIHTDTLGRGFGRACERGHKAIVQLLLQHGIDTHTLGTGLLQHAIHTDTLVRGFVRACERGPVDIVQLLLQHDIFTDTLGRGFVGACEYGCIDIVQLLLQHDIHTDTLGTGFVEACKYGHIDIVQLLLQHDIHTDTLGRGFVGACERGHIDIVKLLLQHDLPEGTLGKGFVNACGKCFWFSSNNIVNILELLLQQHISKDTLCEGFLEASRVGSLEVVQLLLQHHIPVDVLEKGSLEASTHGHVQIVKLLSKRKSDEGCSEAKKKCV